MAETLQWLDWLIISILGVSVIFGVIRGFVREALSLVSWILAVAFSMQFASVVSGHFFESISNPSFRHAAAFCVIFIGTLIIGTLIARIVSKLLASVGLSGIDRLLGIGFGMVRGVIVVGVLLMVGGMTPLSTSTAWQASLLKPHWEPLVTWMQNWVKGGEPTLNKNKDNSA